MELQEIKIHPAPVKVHVTPSVIQVEGLEELKESALDISVSLESLEITEDNAKDAKNLVAAVRKRSDEISKIRKELKKDLLVPLNPIEEQVKEIESIIAKAEKACREKLKALDDIQKESKLASIQNIWEQQLEEYPEYVELLNFDSFFKASYLNKGVKLHKIERECAEFFYKVFEDVQTIKDLENSEKVLSMYFTNGLDVGKAVRVVTLQKIAEKQAQEIIEVTPEEEPKPKEEPKVIFEVSRDVAELVEYLLNEQGIEYKKSYK